MKQSHKQFFYIFILILSIFIGACAPIDQSTTDNTTSPNIGSTTEDTKQLYSIYFEVNGGSRLDSITLYAGENLIVPKAPTREGYFFVGWFSDEDFNEPFTINIMPDKDLTLYARWEKVPNYAKVVDKEDYRVMLDEHIQDAYMRRGDYTEEGYFFPLPSKGEVNILVVPIQFRNDKFTNTELDMLEYGFFGDGSKYETLKSYYYKSSYGQLVLSGEVLPVYTAKYSSSYYDDFYNGYASGVDVLIEEIIAYYSKNYPNLDLAKYDSEGDAFLDAVHIVYSVPMDLNPDSDSIYWAYQYYYSAVDGENYKSWGEYELDSYVFSSIDFFYEIEGEISALTYIHETGHLFGLDDYYDYTAEDANRGGLGGADLMDDTVGDHNPFSKLLLDWIDPIVIPESVMITINAFEKTGDAIILDPYFDSIFAEYLLLSYYTPTGLNATNNYWTTSGLAIYHVNAVLPVDYEELDEYSYYFQNNNSSSKDKLISIIEADGNNSILETSTASNDDLLQQGQSVEIAMADYSVTITVIEQSADSITLEIIYH